MCYYHTDNIGKRHERICDDTDGNMKLGGSTVRYMTKITGAREQGRQDVALDQTGGCISVLAGRFSLMQSELSRGADIHDVLQESPSTSGQKRYQLMGPRVEKA